jgi:murein L,D-transpeptidase YcbB/YkuD
MPSEFSRGPRIFSQTGLPQEHSTFVSIRGMAIALASCVIRSPGWAVALAVMCSTTVFFANQRGADGVVQASLRAFYDRTENKPVWVDVHGRPTDLAWRALGRLRAAGDDGLVEEDYEPADLEYEASALAVGASPVDAAAFDVRLTRNVLKYFRDLHVGRVDPRSLGFHLDHPNEPHDFSAWLQLVVSRRSFDVAIRTLRPPFTQYRRLKQMLPTYREGDAARGRQIELAMERLRWLPDLAGERLIVVNIPMFHLWGWEAERPLGVSVLDMETITGRAGATNTPVFSSRITSIVLNPEWVVPDSIANGEILPAIASDPNYLARNHMKMTREGSHVRIRQLPGPWNALGQMKFVIPNVHGVYLHGTPQPELFERARRDFSHGCVRLQDPLRLAEWVLSGEEGWTRQRMQDVIAQGTTRTITVSRPPHVVLFYVTAAFIPEQGDVRFVDDIYGHDARLDAWLEARTGKDE